jgi:ATP-dependent Lon protease
MECKKEQQAERMKDPVKRAKQVHLSTAYTKKRRAVDEEYRKKDNEYRKQWIAKRKLDPSYRAKCNAQAEQRRKNNPSRHREKVARHKLAKMQRVPTWLSTKQKQDIKAIYAIRDWMNLTMFGVKYEVDHIIPIRGALVSGLHVPDNLQVIKALDNAKKRNIYEMA